MKKEENNDIFSHWGLFLRNSITSHRGATGDSFSVGMIFMKFLHFKYLILRPLVITFCHKFFLKLMFMTWRNYRLVFSLTNEILKKFASISNLPIRLIWNNFLSFVPSSFVNHENVLKIYLYNAFKVKVKVHLGNRIS